MKPIHVVSKQYYTRLAKGAVLNAAYKKMLAMGKLRILHLSDISLSANTRTMLRQPWAQNPAISCETMKSQLIFP